MMNHDRLLASFMEEEEDRMTGYETITVQPPEGGGRMPPGVPLGAADLRGRSVIVNSRRRHPDKRHPWNYPSQGGVIIHHLNAGPPRGGTPRIVEVTDEEEEMAITNPDYPVSESNYNGTADYPNIRANERSPEFPARDYHLEQGNADSDSRPDIQRLDFSADDPEPSPMAASIPPPPPPPPVPPLSSNQPTRTAPSEEQQGSSETEGQQVNDHQEMHIVLRRALARFNDTTQPGLEQGIPEKPDDGPEDKRASREIYTQTHQQQSAKEQPSRHDDHADGGRPSSNPDPDLKSKSRKTDRHSSHQSDRGSHGPRFSNYEPDFEFQEQRPPRERYSGIDLDAEMRRSSTVIERIIITRELDPVTGQPVESVPMREMNNRPAGSRPPRPTSNVVYNHGSVRDSGRRSRSWAPFADRHAQGNWSPRGPSDPTDIAGIVAGMEDDGEVVNDRPTGYMPNEDPPRRSGRSNQAYDISPVEERRHVRPNAARTSTTPTNVPRNAPAKGRSTANAGPPPPPPYTVRDAMTPSRMRVPVSPMASHPHHSWFRQSGPVDSDGSSTVADEWSLRTRVIFAVMLLLCIFLLLALVIVVTLYFTAGPGNECVNGAVCGAPPLGYIIAFAVIGVLTVSFMLIGVILCCFACRMSRAKRMQNYPVSARR